MGGLLLVGFLLRCGYVFGVVGDDGFPQGVEYYPFAENLADGRGYFQQLEGGAIWYSRRPPGLPVLLALARVIAGDRYRWLGRFFHVVLGTLTIAVTYRLGQVIATPAVGWLAAVLMTVYPEAIYYCIQLNPAILMMFLTGLLMLAAARLGKAGRAIDAVMGGFWNGLSVLTRPHLLFFPVAILLYLRVTQPRRAWRLGALYGLVFLLILTPWTLRNYRIHGVLMPSASLFWREFQAANNPANLNNPLGFVLEESALDKNYGEVELDRLMRQKSLAFLRDHPGLYLRLAADRLVRLWRPYPHTEYVPVAYALIMLGSYGLLVPFIGYGLLVSARRGWRGNLIHYLLLVYFSAVCAAVLSYTRYRMTVLPVLLVFAALGLDRFVRGWSETPRFSGPLGLPAPHRGAAIP